jgi:hypothetical protein
MNARPAPLSVPALLVLHLLPGGIATLVFVLLAGPIETAGYPPLAAFLIAIGVGIVPFELGAVVLAGRQSDPRGGILAAVPYRRPMRRREWLILAPGLLVAGVVGFGLLALLEAPIRDALFGWLPDWFASPVPLESVEDYSSSAWIVTLVAYLALNAMVGPVVEELYFRGYLLPRMSQFGRWAPLANVVLFSVYHFWSPWQLLSRLAGITPFAYAVWWKENVYLGIVVHVALNTISVATVIAIVIGKLS